MSRERERERIRKNWKRIWLMNVIKSRNGFIWICFQNYKYIIYTFFWGFLNEWPLQLYDVDYFLNFKMKC